jgi:hypothetical protein
MHPRILSSLEEKRIRAYLKRDGEKEVPVRNIASRAKKFMPAIRRDLDLLEKLLATYTKEA